MTVQETLKELFPDLDLKPFGSRLMGIERPDSDYDFILAVEEKDVDALKQRFERAMFGIKLGYDPEEMSRPQFRGNGFDRSLNPGLYFVAQDHVKNGGKWEDIPTVSKVDILVCTPPETSRRLRTLNVLRNTPGVSDFVRSLKGNAPAWAALHSIVERAYHDGLDAFWP